MLSTGRNKHLHAETDLAPDHHAAITHDRVEMLYSSAGLSLVISFAVAAVFVYVHANNGNADPRHYLWLGGLVLVLFLRLLWNQLHARRPDTLSNQGWLHSFRLGGLATALCWGVAGVLFYQPQNEALHMFTILVIAGIAAGALSSLAADYVTYRNYVVACLAPAAVLALWVQSGLQTGSGMLIVLLMLFLLRSAQRTSDSIIHSLQLRYENASLLEDLEHEKNRLVNEAETMMGTVLASAPIALWAIDMQGIITFMDGKRLEQQTGIRLPSIGHNLLEHFADLESVLEDTRSALQGQEVISEVEIGDASYEVHYSPLQVNDEQTGAIGVAIDISERKAHEQELMRRANYDALTGLANRTLAMETINMAFARARRYDTKVGLYFLDLDNFKAINDTLGHQAGDELLCHASERLRRCLRETDFAARISGDEFLVIAEGLQRAEDAEALAHKLVSAFQTPFGLNGRQLFTTTSIGIAIYPRDGADATALMQSADTAMYHAKDSGRNSYRFFTQEMQHEAMRHLQIENELRRALERKELELVYQPKVDSKRRCICGAEALLRWHSAELGLVRPDEFVPVAEVAGLMPQIGEWILKTACKEAAGWEKLHGKPVHVAINISPQQFRKTDLLANVTEALADSGLSPTQLELEITESLLVQDAPEVQNVLDDLTDMGITLALDDFGTGYSSLSYLRKFPLQVLKIDRAFVQDLGKDSDSESLVYAIIAMARSLRMKTVAEGVETEEQLQYLQARGVDMLQGYYYSKPLSVERFRTLLANSAPCRGVPLSQADSCESAEASKQAQSPSGNPG